MKKKIKLLTYFGFPVKDEESLETGAENLKDEGKRGVALLLSIMVICVMMLFTTDLIVSSQVNLELAVSHRDNLKSEYMAKSAANLAIFLVTGDRAQDLGMAQQDPTKKSTPTDSASDIWALLNGIPIGGATAEMMTKMQAGFELSAVSDSSILDQLQLFDGQFTMTVTDESQKINVNAATQGRGAEAMAMLTALFSCPAEALFLDEKKLKPKELAYKIKDWVDSDNKAESDSGVSDENDPYENKKPLYKVKNAPFNSVEELRMIDGWDDEMQAVFAPFLTVFPVIKSGEKAKINLNTAPRELLACLFPNARKDCGAKYQEKLKARDEDKEALLSDSGKIAEVLRENFCYTEQATGDGAQKSTWFSNGSTVFRISAVGEVGNQTRTITMVIERTVPDGKEIKTSYRILYWKMI